MNIKIFVQDQCPNCPPAKEIGAKLEKEGHNINYFDTNSVDGLSEAVLHDVLATPSIVVVDKNKKEVKSWRGDVPNLDDVRKVLQSNEK